MGAQPIAGGDALGVDGNVDNLRAVGNDRGIEVDRDDILGDGRRGRRDRVADERNVQITGIILQRARTGGVERLVLEVPPGCTTQQKSKRHRSGDRRCAGRSKRQNGDRRRRRDMLFRSGGGRGVVLATGKQRNGNCRDEYHGGGGKKMEALGFHKGSLA